MRMRILYLLLFFIIYGHANSYAQIYNSTRVIHETDPTKMSVLQKMEDTLVYYADSMLSTPVQDARIDGSYAFIKSMKNFMQTAGSYEYQPKNLAKRISVLQSDDKRFKIYSWEVVRSNAEVRYYGALHFDDGSYQPLLDVSDQIIRGAEDSVFYDMRWYGCVYYNILQKKIGNQTAYFLMGYNGNLINGDKKIVEAFGFDKSGKAIFGAPLFSIKENEQRKTQMRFILNYQKNAKVSLNHDKDRDMIVYDHCESSVGDAYKKNTYVPDGTYDGLFWDGRFWQQKENVIDIIATPEGQAPLIKPTR